MIIFALPPAAGVFAQMAGRAERRAHEELPAGHHAREVEHAVANLREGHAPWHTLHSPVVLLAAIQVLRAETPGWGARFKRDPRKFSSTPRRASVEQVTNFINASSGSHS